MRRIRITWLVSLLILLPSSAAQPPLTKHSSNHLDLHGDPLPKGAIARLGTLRWRGDGIHFLAVSPDGKSLVTATSANSNGLTEWDMATARKRGILRSEAGRIQFAAYSPDGKELFATGRFNHVNVYCATMKNVLRPIKGHSRIRAMALSKNGKILATASSDQTIRVWDTKTGVELWRQQIKDDPQWISLALSTDGKRLLQTGYRYPPTIWDAVTGHKIWQSGEPIRTRSATISPDGSTAVICWHGVIHFLDLKSKKWSKMNLGTMWDVLRAKFSPNGRILACAKPDAVSLFDWPSRKIRRVLRTPGDYLRTLTFTHDGKTLVAAGDSGRIHFWNVATGRPERRFPGHNARLESVMFAPDGRTVATMGSDEAVHLWDGKTGKHLDHFVIQPGKKQVSVIEKKGYSFTILNTTDKWNQIKYRMLAFNSLTANTRNTASQYEKPASALSPDGKLFALAGAENQISLYERATGKNLRKLTGHTRAILTIAFSPDGTMLASGGDDGIVCLWDIDGEKPVERNQITEFNGRRIIRSSITAIRFSPDNTALAANVGDIMYLWDAFNRRILLKARRNIGAGSRLVFSPDGRLIASSAGDGALRIWETEELSLVKHFLGTKYPSLLPDISPDTGQRRRKSRITGIDFSPDGRTIVTGHRDTTALIWDLTYPLKPHVRLAEDDLELMWGRLGNADAGWAWEAIWTMAANPKLSVEFLRSRLQPTPKVTSKQLAQWLADLNRRRFAVRQKATTNLERAGDAARSVLQRAMKQKSTLEFQRRVKLIYAKLGPSPDKRRNHRALAVLEYIGDDSAKRVLERLAQGADGARQTREAKRILQRLGR